MDLLKNIDRAHQALVQSALDAYHQGRFLAAVEGLRILAVENDESAEAHYFLAMALEHGNGRDRAECYRHFERALEIVPDWFEAL